MIIRYIRCIFRKKLLPGVHVRGEDQLKSVERMFHQKDVCTKLKMCYLNANLSFFCKFAIFLQICNDMKCKFANIIF